jgi:hypothetical protein
MMRITVLLVGCLVVAICLPVFAGDAVSPLFDERLGETLDGWQRGTVTPSRVEEGDPTWALVSVNPWSVCLGSLCINSTCLGSLCTNSGCIGSGCAGSTCAGSVCFGSICGASACYGVTMCARLCGSHGDATIPVGPLYNAPSCSPLNCPEM